jgi:hypothetical protein
MPTLRQQIAELERRVLAVEARQILWAQGAAASGSPEAGATSVSEVLPSLDVLRAVADLAVQVAERGSPVEQINIGTEDGYTYAVAHLEDGDQVSATFATPRNFRARVLRCALEQSYGLG